MKDHITIEGHDGAFAAYIARPKTLPALPERQKRCCRLPLRPHRVPSGDGP
jgi:hypothetical protein